MQKPIKVKSIDELKSHDFLVSRFPEISALSVHPMDTLGYSGARFSTLNLKSNKGKSHLVLKELDLTKDWFSRRTKDKIGREAAILQEPAFNKIFEIFQLPYQAVYLGSEKVGLLMDDVSDGLFPDERKCISEEDQDQILKSLARLHATFWESNQLQNHSWLQSTRDFLYLMGPLDHQHTAAEPGQSTRNVQLAIKAGWADAMKLLPSNVKEWMQKDPSQVANQFQDLPMTLIHGDTKVANFAKMPSGELCVLDWAFVGCAPCTFDIGWFVAVNASRLYDSKEQVFEKYRFFLEAELQCALDSHVWKRLKQAGIVCGGFMLLWSKASAVVNQREGAREEWDWWMGHFERIC